MVGILDIPPAVCETDYFAQLMAGNVLAPRMNPYATCYGGHQFGNWAGQLGDGRAINLPEGYAHWFAQVCQTTAELMVQWNLVQLANAVFPLIEDAKPLEGGLKLFVDNFQRGWQIPSPCTNPCSLPNWRCGFTRTTRSAF